MKVVELTDVHKHYMLGQTRVDALRGVEFAIAARGDIAGRLHPAGCERQQLAGGQRRAVGHYQRLRDHKLAVDVEAEDVVLIAVGRLEVGRDL